MNLLNPFDEVFNHTYLQIRKKIERFYGVKDADEYFNNLKKSILSKCTKDTHKIVGFESLAEYCESVQMYRKYNYNFKENDSKTLENA